MTPTLDLGQAKVLAHAADSIARWTSAPVSLVAGCVRMRDSLHKKTPKGETRIYLGNGAWT